MSDATDTPFRDLADFAPDALLLVNSNGVIAYANRYAHTLFGYAPETLRGRVVEELIPVESRHKHSTHRRGFSGNPQLREMGSRLVPLFGLRRDGTQFRAEVRLSPIQATNGMMTAAAIRDATEQDRVMAEIKAARETAEKANEAKGRFVAAVSHDLRQPLQTLRIVNATLRRQSGDGEMQNLLQQEQRSLDAMTDLLNALLNLSKLESGAVKPDNKQMSLALLFDDLRQQFAGAAMDKGLRLELDAGGGALLNTDRALFGDLLQNLIGNAIRYTDAGRVHVRARRVAGGGVTIEVRDTGIGIDSDALPRIWDDFYQVPVREGAARRGGTGLGLAIVRRIAGILSFPLQVTSKVGVGTAFTVQIPEERIADTLARTGPSHAPATATQEGRKIILVEDDEAVRAATALYLKLDGHTVYGAASLSDVDALLVKMDGAPAIVISDFRLQRDECGADAIARIRAKYGGSLPAIVLTGDTAAIPDDLFAGTTTRLLDKPIDVTVLTATIAELLKPEHMNA